MAVTDWEDIYKLVNLHRVAENKKEAVRMAIMAGIDMSMTPNDFEFTKLLIELVKEGTIREDYVVDGKNEDSDQYSLLKQEWKKRS